MLILGDIAYWVDGQSKISLSSPKIDGFKNPPVKIDGFGRTHQTHADGAPGILNGK